MDGNDKPNYITLAGTLSYQEIQIQDPTIHIII